MNATKEPSFADLCDLLEDPVLTLFVDTFTKSVNIKSVNKNFQEIFGLPNNLSSVIIDTDVKPFVENLLNAVELKRCITTYLHSCDKTKPQLWKIKIKPFQNNYACVFFHQHVAQFSHKELSYHNWSQEEYNLRVELAAAYRLFELFGWTDLIYNHLTVRLPATPNQPATFLINPFGLLFSEITASSLVKIDVQGEIIEKGSTNFGINKAGYVIHSAIHEGRKDVNCVMHCHSTAGVAVSCLKSGLVHISQNSAIVGDVSYHDYQGLAIKEEEKVSLVNDLGPKNMHLILRNHGLLTCGRTIAEAFFNMYMLNRACEMQVAAFSAANGMENLIIPDESLQKFTQNAAANFNPEGIGQKEFSALLRRLDSIDQSYKW